jgi:hypothetical protein
MAVLPRPRKGKRVEFISCRVPLLQPYSGVSGLGRLYKMFIPCDGFTVLLYGVFPKKEGPLVNVLS